MGQGHRTATGDLIIEQGNDRPRRPDHIAKPDHGIDRGTARRIRPAGKVLHHNLGHAFAGPHHVLGAHGLVRRNQDEPAHAHVTRHLRNDLRAQHIVGQARGRIAFHKRDMFVSCRMQHDLHAVFGHDAAQQSCIGHRSQNRHKLHPGFLRQNFQLQVKIIQRKLADFEQDQPLGQHAHQLAAQFRADGAASAGNQDAAVDIGFRPA